MKTKPKTIKDITKRFREKFGRFYYSDKVKMDWEKPEKQNVIGGIPTGHNGYCIASDDIEQFITTEIKELLEGLKGTEGNTERETKLREDIQEAIK